MEILSIFEANQDEWDIQDFQSDIFYIKICEVLFPEVNFQDLTPGETVDQVGDNINAIIDYIQQIAQDIDLSQLDGYMIANGDLPSIFTILNLVHGLILATIEGEDGQLEQEEYPDDLESDEKQKIDQMLYDEQQIDDYSDLPVGNVRDLLKKKKLSSDTANQEQKSASKLKQSDSANKINDPNLANFNKKDNSHISSKSKMAKFIIS